MKAFVTGATGFVGSHLVDLLLKEGFEVSCLKRKTSSVKWLEGKKVKYVDGDLYSNEALEAAIKDVDYVFHVAGVVKAKNEEGFQRGNNWSGSPFQKRPPFLFQRGFPVGASPV